LNGNASEFFNLKNLPQPNALKIARRNWSNGDQRQAATARQGASA
jgi:hypothetical protein